MTSLIFKNNTNNVTNIVPGTITSNVNLTLPNSNGTLATTTDINNAVTNANNTMLNKNEYAGVNITGVVKTTNQMVRLFVGPNSKYKTLSAAMTKALEIKSIIARAGSQLKITVELENNFELKEQISWYNTDLTGISIKGIDGQFCNVIVNLNGVTCIDLSNSRGLRIEDNLKFTSKQNTALNAFIALRFNSDLVFMGDVDINLSGEYYIYTDDHSRLSVSGSGKGTRTHNVRLKITNNKLRNIINAVRSRTKFYSFTLNIYTEVLTVDNVSFAGIYSRERGIVSTSNLNINYYHTADKVYKHMEFLVSYQGGIINFLGGIIANKGVKTKRLVMFHQCGPSTTELVGTEVKDFAEDTNILLLDFCTICHYGVLTGRNCKFTNIGRIRTSRFPLNVVGNIANAYGANVWLPAIDSMLPQKY